MEYDDLSQRLKHTTWPDTPSGLRARILIATVDASVAQITRMTTQPQIIKYYAATFSAALFLFFMAGIVLSGQVADSQNLYTLHMPLSGNTYSLIQFLS